MKESYECRSMTHIGPESCGHRSLSRRSQNGRVLWDRMRRLITRWLPLPSVCHPYPLRRLGRSYLGQEPDAGNPLVRIGEGLCLESSWKSVS
jgi:hypothetical protein